METKSGLGVRLVSEKYDDHTKETSEPIRIENEEDYWEENDEDLPIISIELERLVGYKPSTEEEIESIRSQLVQAMWVRFKNSNNSGDKEYKEGTISPISSVEDSQDEPPPDFEDQILELLNSRVARFGSVSDDRDNITLTALAEESSTPPTPFLELSYPARIEVPSTTGSGLNVPILKDTARLWSDVRDLSYALEDTFNTSTNDMPQQPQDSQLDHDSNQDILPQQDHDNEDIDFWYRLTDHLERTCRKLSWKHTMALELKDVLARETLYKKHQQWIKTQRMVKLEQLYQVRETLVHRADLAQDDLERLMSIKDTAVRRDLLKYDQSVRRRQQNGGASSSLLGGGELSFPEQFELMGLMPKDSQLYEEEDWGGTLDDDDDIDYYQSDYSDYSGEDDEDDLSAIDGDEEDDKGDDEDDKVREPLPTEMPTHKNDDPDSGIPTNKIEGVDTNAAAQTPFWGRNRERRRKKKRAQKKKERAEAQRRENLEKRKEHEALLQATHTTQEVVLAQTLCKALAKKVTDVEDLLENLQEEEWAAQEEIEEKSKTINSNNETAEKSFSLLDQILAMILGALPMEPGSKDREQHFCYIKEEHDLIIEGWKAYFGRLPQAYVPGGQSSDAEPSIVDEQEDDAEENSDIALDKTKKIPISANFRTPVAVKLSKIEPKKGVINPMAHPPKKTPQEQRMALGIVDNEDGDWDAMIEEDDKL